MPSRPSFFRVCAQARDTGGDVKDRKVKSTNKAEEAKDSSSSKIFLLSATYASANVTPDYVALNLSYVLGLDKKAALAFARKAEHDGAVCLAFGSSEECKELMAKLQLRDMVCAVEIGAADNTKLTSTTPKAGEGNNPVINSEEEDDDWSKMAATWVPSVDSKDMANVQATKNAVAESPISSRNIDSSPSLTSQECEEERTLQNSASPPPKTPQLSKGVLDSPNTIATEASSVRSFEIEVPFCVSFHSPSSSLSWTPKTPTDEDRIQEEGEEGANNLGNVSDDEATSSILFPQFHKTECKAKELTKTSTGPRDGKDIKPSSEASNQQHCNAGRQLSYRKSAESLPSSANAEIGMHMCKGDDKKANEVTANKGESVSSVPEANAEKETESVVSPPPPPPPAKKKGASKQEDRGGRFGILFSRRMGAKEAPLPTVDETAGGLQALLLGKSGDEDRYLDTMETINSNEVKEAVQVYIGFKAMKAAFVYPNGVGTYNGEWVGGIPHGVGTFFWTDGAEYSGEWREGSPEGDGKFVYPDGGINVRSSHSAEIIQCLAPAKEGGVEEQSAVVLQTTWRSASTRQNYGRLRSLTLVLQALARGRRDRKRYLTLLHACNTCQAFVKSTQKRLALKEAKMKSHAILKETEERAATSIQTAWSRHILEVEGTREQSAVVLQTTWRSASAQQSYGRLRSATAAIQALARGRRERSRYLSLVWGCIVCQAAIRGMQARTVEMKAQSAPKEIEEYVEIKAQVIPKETEERAATSIQTAWSQHMLGVVDVREQSAVVLQTTWRSASARQNYGRFRSSTLVLQALASGRRDRKRYLTLLRACSTCQAFVKSTQKRLALKEAKMKSHVTLKETEERAATSIQMAWSRHVLVVEGMREQSAVVLQTTWRSASARTGYERIRSSTIAIQSLARGRRERKRYLTLLRACVLCQAFVRSAQTRAALTSPVSSDDEMGPVAEKTGAKYDGDLVRGIPHGTGRMYFPDGSRYSGQWKRGKPAGKGKIYFPGGEVHVGKWGGSTFVPLHKLKWDGSKFVPLKGKKDEDLERKPEHEASKDAQGHVRFAEKYWASPAKKSMSSKQDEKKGEILPLAGSEHTQADEESASSGYFFDSDEHDLSAMAEF